MKNSFGKIIRKAAKYKRTAFVLFIIWTLVGLVFGAFGVIALSADSRTGNALSIILDSLLRTYIWGVLSPLVYIFARRFHFDPRKPDYKVIAYNIIFGLALTHVYAWICIFIASLGNPNYFAAFPSLWALWTRQVIIFSWYTFISLYVTSFLTIQAVLFFRNYRNEEAKNASLQAELSRAQLSALKMQLHPHFLFNSLHSISSLILLDPKRANTMVALLGDFLRQTLDHSNDQIVTLQEEFEFLRCYLDIEKTRFDDRLSVNFDVSEETLNAGVPHLIVQPLVENAVKHGISPFSAPGHIEITSRTSDGVLILGVRNSGGDKAEDREPPAGESENAFGLGNVRSRLKSIYGGAARLTVLDLKEQGFFAELAIPFTIHGAGREVPAGDDNE